MIKTLKAKIFVPTHIFVTDNIVEFAEYNIVKINDIVSHMVELCKMLACFVEPF